MRRGRANSQENFEGIHEQILAQGGKRFPLESYRQLRDNGATRQEALEMLGFQADDPELSELN